MRSLRATFIVMVFMLFIVPWGSAEIRTLGVVENGSGTLDLKNASWELSGTFNDVGPDFKDPNVLESEGDFFDSFWKIRNRAFETTIVEGNVTELPWVNPVDEGNDNYRIDNGVIYLNSTVYKDLTFTFSGRGRLQAPEEDQKYTVN
jgi:hypothetical protein